MEVAFETTKYYAIKNEDGRFRGLSILFNIALYLLIASRDVQAVKIDALTHPDEWTRKLHARIILLTIYEWDADRVSGRELREALDLMFIPDDIKQKAVDVLRVLRNVQRKVTKKYSFVRNATIGHRDPNAIKQYRAIRDLDMQGVWDICAEFYKAVDRFLGVLTKLTLAGNSLPSFLCQWTESSDSD